MSQDFDQTSKTILIGPGLNGCAAEEDCAERPVPPQVEGRRLLVRLVVAFVLLVIVAVACFIVLPLAGIPPWVPLAAFAVIAIAVLTNASAEGQLPGSQKEEAGCEGGEGRPVGCCPGPRPPRFLSRPGRRR